MKKVLKSFHKGSKGFTLIELLVVVAILGVLAAIALPQISNLIGAGNTAGAKGERSTVQTAVDAAMATSGKATIPGAPVTVDSTHDMTLGSEKLSTYIRGGLGVLKGTYSISADGNVTQTATGY